MSALDIGADAPRDGGKSGAVLNPMRRCVKARIWRVATVLLIPAKAGIKYTQETVGRIG
jgi:hypothetical protein